MRKVGGTAGYAPVGSGISTGEPPSPSTSHPLPKEQSCGDPWRVTGSKQWNLSDYEALVPLGP